MTARRWSGELRIRVRYDDRGVSDRFLNGRYHCSVSRPATKGAEVYRVIVGAPAFLTHAVDSPEAFDAAAHAALSFASDAGFPVETYAATNEHGWHIGRSEATRWPRKEE